MGIKAGEAVEAPFSLEEVEELIKKLKKQAAEREDNIYMAGLTAKEVATVIAHVIGNGGLWSQARVRGLGISQYAGRKLKNALLETGLLVERKGGSKCGYMITPSVETFTDALDYLPDFPV